MKKEYNLTINFNSAKELDNFLIKHKKILEDEILKRIKKSGVKK